MLEAARMDGAGVWTELTRVILPIALPGIAATALICVIFSWNEFFFAYFLTTTKGPTVPVFLVSFLQSEGQYWASLAAAATLASLPVILAGWIAQKQLVRGLSLGALK
jgi:sorbitol/mannitol transport system permease protein